MSTKHKTIIKLFASAFVLMAAGCGYSDYPGHPGHNTDKEAYVPSWGTVISGWGEEYDGTYVYTVGYKNQRWMKPDFQFKAQIKSYRNKVMSSNPHRPNIFPDGDSMEMATGFSGGHFETYWTAFDLDPNADGFEDNFDQSHPLDADGNWIAPGLVLASNVPEQEIDGMDWDLQSTIKNASQLLNTLIANGGSIENLQLGVNALEFNGQKVNIDTFNVSFRSSISNPQIVLQNQPATKSLIKAILANTENLKKVDLKVHFDNGMEFDLPNKVSVAFNHDVLSKFVK